MFSSTTLAAIAVVVVVGCGLGLATITTAAPPENDTTTNETAINDSAANGTQINESIENTTAGTESPDDESDEQRDQDGSDEEAQENDTDEQQDPPDDPGEVETGDVEERVDGDLVITGWEYDRDREAMTIHFDLRRERPKTVTVTEAISVNDAGTGQMSIRQERLLPGESSLTVRVTPSPNGEAAVAVTTAESIDRGQGAYVSTGYTEQNPFRHFGGTTGLFSGVGLSILLSGLSALWVLRREESGVMKA